MVSEETFTVDGVVRRHYEWWGTFGKNPPPNPSMSDLQWVRIVELSNGHIENILQTEIHHLPQKMIDTFETELAMRKLTNTIIPEVEDYG